MNRHRTGRVRLVAAGLCVAAVAAGIAATTTAFGGAPPASGARVPKAAGHTEIVGGTASERALLRDIVAGMQPTVIEKIEITGSGNHVALHFIAPPDRWNLAFWQDDLVAASFRDRANAAGDNLTVSIFDREADGGSLNGGPATPLPPAQPGDAAAARQLFENAAAKSGVSLDKLTIDQPDGVAVEATLQSNDPASFLVHQMPAFLNALGDHSNLDGTYISLVDSSGHTVWETSSNDRISEGSVGSRPDLAGCSPVSNWGNPPPPCPVSSSG
jgi:hypothetical protein